MKSRRKSRTQEMLQVTINGRKIRAEEGKTVLEVSLDNGIYIPHLCYHAGIGGSRLIAPYEIVYRGKQEIRNDQEIEYGGCNLCLVEVEGNQELCHACTTPIDDEMVVCTHTPQIQEQRKEQLNNLLRRHPHVCLTCGLAEGCDRQICSMGIPEEARCCWKFGTCVLQKIAAEVGFDQNIHYAYEKVTITDENPLFIIRYDLCINCLMCVVACRAVAGREAIGFVNQNGRLFVGTKAPTLKNSKCKFCLACVEVCPTGALREKDPMRKKSKIRSGMAVPMLPPEKKNWGRLDEESVRKIPAVEGVYSLSNEAKELIQISGTENLRTALEEELGKNGEAKYFEYEEDEMFTMRERQLIQQYMKKHGKMPRGNDDMYE